MISKNFFLTVYFLVVSIVTFSQAEKKIVFNLKNKTFKIFLPKGFNENAKYPILYTLDGSDFFEPVMEQVKQLVSVDVIPPLVLVAINNKDRVEDLRLGKDKKFTPTSFAFKNFIEDTLRVYIKDRLKIQSPFEILMGHSDGAEFALQLFTENNSPWRGVILLSPNNINNNEEKMIQDFASHSFPRNKYCFIATGTRDARSRKIGALKLDSLLIGSQNKNLKIKALVYNADHVGIAMRGLNDGIAFMFDDYIQESGFNQELVSSYKTQNIGPMDAINAEVSKVENICGINLKPSEQGLLFLGSRLIRNSQDIDAFRNYRFKILKSEDENDDYYGDLYASVNNYEKAILNYKNYFNKEHDVVVFDKIINILNQKLSTPQDAIQLIKNTALDYHQLKYFFDYELAKTYQQANTNLADAKNLIKQSIANYQNNEVFTKREAIQLSDIINGK